MPLPPRNPTILIVGGVKVTWNDENNKDNIRPDKVTAKLTDGTTVVSTKEVKNDSWKHIFEDIPVFNGSDKV